MNSEVKDPNARFDLGFLRDFCDGDEGQMQYFLEKFKKQWPVEMENLKVALETNDREAVARLAHGFRPQLDFVGLKEDASLVFEIEQAARNQHNFDSLVALFHRLKGWQ